jgi:hypothetical protein
VIVDVEEIPRLGEDDSFVGATQELGRQQWISTTLVEATV